MARSGTDGSIKAVPCAQTATEASDPSWDRWEDISHAQYDFVFASKLRAVGEKYYADADFFGLTRVDMARFLVTALAQRVRRPRAGGRRAIRVRREWRDGRREQVVSHKESREGRVWNSNSPHLLLLAVAARNDGDAAVGEVGEDQIEWLLQFAEENLLFRQRMRTVV